MNIKKNLIFFLPNFVKGGASSAIFRLCKHLDKKKYNLFIISLNKNELKNDLSKYCSEIFEINSRSVLLSSLKLTQIVKYSIMYDFIIFVDIIYIKSKILITGW